jgi:peptidoglycan/LPS O-acetylase OafA/YrhL
VADAAEPLARAPLWTTAPLVLAQVVLFGLACARLRGRPDVRLLVAGVALTLAAFLLSRRADAEAIRFLTPLYLPCAVLVAWALVQRFGARTGLAAAGVLAVLNLAGAASLLAAWRGADRAKAPFHLPDLTALRSLLQGRGIAHAYASYGPAYRLSYETNEALVGWTR